MLSYLKEIFDKELMKMIRFGQKLLIALAGDIFFSLFCTTLSSLFPNNLFSLSTILIYFCFSLSGYLFLGIPSSYLADWFEPFYSVKVNKLISFLFGFGIYAFFGIFTGNVFGYIVGGNDLFYSNSFLGNSLFGALASLGFFFSQLLLNRFMFKNRG
jgi:hypothetical protein